MAADRVSRSGHRFESCLAAFLEARRASTCSSSYEKNARPALRQLFRHLKSRGVRDLRSVDEGDIVSFAAALKRRETQYGQAMASATQRGWLSFVRVFFAWLEKRGVILSNPARAVTLPTHRRLPRHVLSEAQARRLMSAPTSYERFRVSPALGLRDRAVLELLYGTGLRLGELLRLDLTDVDLARGTLLIRQGKGRRDRVVPLAGRAAVALDAYLAEGRRELARNFREPSLFLSWRGKRVEEGRIERLVQRYAAAARLPGRVHPHALRHACATHLLQGGADIRHVQTLLGHASLATTVLYTKVALKDLAQVLARAHPSERAWRRRVSRSR